MDFANTLPHWFIVAVAVVVVIFVVKSLIKIALIIGIVGLIIYLGWTLHLLDRIAGHAMLPGTT